MAFPPGPLTSMGLWVDKAESFKAMGLKLGVYSKLSGHKEVWEQETDPGQRQKFKTREVTGHDLTKEVINPMFILGPVV